MDVGRIGQLLPESGGSYVHYGRRPPCCSIGFDISNATTGQPKADNTLGVNKTVAHHRAGMRMRECRLGIVIENVR